MGQHSDKVRQALLDAAEELFARHGIDAVSNRSIAEHAGASNHSAIAYHFGGRDELIHALVRRYLDGMDARRSELMAALPADFELRDVVACRILPFVEQLNSLPVPSWRARFLDQARTVPSVAAVLAEAAISYVRDFETLSALSHKSLGSIPEPLLRARSGIIAHVVLGICAEYEASLEQRIQRGTWIDVGYFLVDTAAGLLAAPVTRQGERFVPPPTPILV